MAWTPSDRPGTTDAPIYVASAYTDEQSRLTDVVRKYLATLSSGQLNALTSKQWQDLTSNIGWLNRRNLLHEVLSAHDGDAAWL